jgi:hypothetical protein
MKNQMLGRLVKSSVPSPLPPNPPINMTDLYPLLDQANTALGRLEAAELLMGSEMYDHAMEQCHFALEKIMKAALIKHGGESPASARAGHNLLIICNTKVGGRKILQSKALGIQA